MNILLLTDMPPCDNYTAGIVKMQLCRFLLGDEHKVDCFFVLEPSLKPHIPQDIQEHMAFESCSKPNEKYGLLKLGKLRSLLCNNYHSIVTLDHIAEKVGRFAKGKHYDLMWGDVEGQSMIKLVRRTAKKVKLPYVVQVWDPPEWWLMENRFDAITRWSVMREFGALLRGARCCLTASWNMEKEYKDLYGANTQAVVPGIPAGGERQQCIKSERKTYSEFRIAFAGQIYAREEFWQLLHVLNNMRWFYRGRDIKLFFYGWSYFAFSEVRDGNIVLRGWVKQEKMLSELAEMDLLYCPYWFSEDFRIVSRLSFPSKLTSYLRTGTPVLVHAPKYASTSQFIDNGKNGYVCNSLDAKELHDILVHIMSDPSRAQVGRNGFRLYQEYLTDKTMRRDFYKALGIV